MVEFHGPDLYISGRSMLFMIEKKRIGIKKVYGELTNDDIKEI